jgi:spore coat polysaccharide biosynthesis predicted glycosyltransferase SpsG
MSSPHTLAPAAPSANPLAVLVVDGGRRLGFGHVGRCLAIWEELGGRAVFDVVDADVVRVLKTLGAPVDGAHASAPVALIDHAAPTSAAEVQRRHARGQRVCLLDDPGTGRLSADLVVDPPTGANWPPAGGRRLAGFEHVLLRRDIRAAAIGGRERTGARPRVLLAMGGSDPEGLTPALADALGAAGVAVTSVLGPAYHGPRPRSGEVLADPRDWPRALASAELLLTRFGHTLLEAAYLGTPALAMAVGDHALADARAFAAHGTAQAIEAAGPEDAERVVGRVLATCGDATLLAAMSARGHRLVDGLGARRVAGALEALRGPA